MLRASLLTSGDIEFILNFINAQDVHEHVCINEEPIQNALSNHLASILIQQERGRK
jgi:hypothetical protein